ncbi:hypothetical protein V8G54_028810 [Vigna mungo]|uniref:Uncharacterized protein n=1 Tax=Vigna mungo TaxID=3915 RepID=A0AAQ3MU09_VIGMU
MTENTPMKDMQTQLTSILNWIEKHLDRGKANRDLLMQFQTANNDRMDQMHKLFDSFMSSDNRHIDASNSTGSPLLMTPSVSAVPVRNISLGFPHFDGTTPALEWIFKAEQFFNYHHTLDQERKNVIPWFQMLHRMAVVRTWSDLTRALESHFGPSPFDSPTAELFKLYQSGTVSEYYLKFMTLANRSEGLTDGVILNCFLSGLNRDIRRDVVAQCPTNLLCAVSLAKLYEEKYAPLLHQRSTTYTHRYSPLSSTSANLTATKDTVKQVLPLLLPTPTSPPLRQSNLLLLQVEEENFDHDQDIENIQSATHTASDDGLEDNHHLSLNAMKGGFGVGTIHFGAHINSLPVTVLVDGGSSNNFLQPRIVKFLKLDIEAAPLFKVMIGNGSYMQAEGLINDLHIHVQGVQFELPVFLLPISGADMILGASWLKSIGSHIVDYNALQLKFLHEGKFITLQGTRDSLPMQTHFHHIRRMVNTASIVEVFSMQLLTDTPSQSPLFVLPEDVAPYLALLLRTYSSFFDTPKALPPPRCQDHSIPLMEGSQPVKVKPYRYPDSQKAEIAKLVQGMLEEGIIQPSKSPFSSPIILVKKNGSWRVCMDYRALNAITIKDNFPISTVDDLIDELFGAVFFSKLDLRSGYHQILLNLEDIYKTAFRTHHGHYEWLVMPFGATWEEHLYHLELVLKTLQQHQLYARLSKCSFGVREIDYLGHTLSGTGVAMDTSKLEVVKQWPIPTTVKQLRGFLGLTGYFRRFVKGYASIAAPLTDLLKKDSFQWTQTASRAFAKLKDALTSAPVLAIPNFEPFVLETNASGSGIGVVLSQCQHPIAYFSKKLSPCMQKQFVYIREFYAIIEALAKFRHYLLGHKFIVKTDQKSLKELLEQQLQTPEQQQWLPKFLGYDFTIQYKPGKENVPADAFSRSCVLAWSESDFKWLEQIVQLTKADIELSKLMLQHSNGTLPTQKYVVKDGLLFKSGRLMIPADMPLKNKILQEFHDSKVGGHAGTTKTIAIICNQFYWPKMQDDISSTKVDQVLPYGFLQPLPIPQQI